MDHAPFIITAYTAATVLLGWCALAPWLRGRRLRRELRAAFNAPGAVDAPDA